LFWRNEKQWAWIAPHLLTNLTGPERDDDEAITAQALLIKALSRVKG
jgi:hypothetical protein